MFTIQGLIQDKNYTLTYTDGLLTGDPEVIQKAIAESKIDHGSVGIQPEVIESNYLSQEIPAYDLITRFVFDLIESEDNDWESVPEDSVF